MIYRDQNRTEITGAAQRRGTYDAVAAAVARLVPLSENASTEGLQRLYLTRAVFRVAGPML